MKEKKFPIPISKEIGASVTIEIGGDLQEQH